MLFTQTSITFHLKPLHFKNRQKNALYSLFTKCINWYNYLNDTSLDAFQKYQEQKYHWASQGFCGF